MFSWLAQKSLANITSNFKILTYGCLPEGLHISEVNRQRRQSTDRSLIYILLSIGPDRPTKDDKARSYSNSLETAVQSAGSLLVRCSFFKHAV